MARHPIRDCAARIEAAVKDVADLDPVFMPAADKAAALEELTRLEASVAELRLRVLATADDLAADTGARDAAAWLAAAVPVGHRAARADAQLAAGLERWHQVRTGAAEGRVTVGQARVMVRTLDELPDDLDTSEPEVLARAEAELCRLAEHHPPEELRRLGLHLLDVVAPEVAEAAEARRLAREEIHAQAATRLTITPNGDGTTRLHCTVPDQVGQRLVTYLEAFAQPRHTALDADGRARPRARVLGEAFGELLEHIDPYALPAHGGDATTVVVTITLDQLRDDLGAAAMTDTPITSSEARRLACTAKILPAVLGGKGEVLDLGRGKRLFTPAQHKALRLQHPRCQAEGCTVPSTWCDAHHHDPWTNGGPTDLVNAILLCGHHHRRAHDIGYDHTRLPNGDLRYHRRT